MLNEMDFDAKKTLIAGVSVDDGAFLALFFQARNLAIEAAMAAVREHLRPLDCTATWQEDSRRVAIRLTLVDRTLTHERIALIDRETVQVGRRDAVSACAYRLVEVLAHQAPGRRLSAKVVAFEAALAEPGFHEFLAAQVNRANFPFGYTSRSSF